MRAELSFAREALVTAELALDPYERYAAAQLAALRAAAAVVGGCARPVSSRRRRTAWQVLSRRVPAATEWAGYFELCQQRLTLLRAQSRPEVSERQADDHLRDAQQFLSAAEEWLEPVSWPELERQGSA